MISCVYGGSGNFLGLEYAIEDGLIKDPRDKDSTPQSIKEYYLMAWRIIVQYYINDYDYDYKDSKNIEYLHIWQINRCLLYKIYENLPYGYPSARPYIFPKEVLDLEIDFTKGLEDIKQE